MLTLSDYIASPEYLALLVSKLPEAERAQYLLTDGGQ
jgi:hypothetical protein